MRLTIRYELRLITAARRARTELHDVDLDLVVAVNEEER
jgi:hypothetical protein